MDTITYYGRQEVKDRFVKRADDHLTANIIVKGTYGEFEEISPGTEYFVGCAITCLSTEVIKRDDYGNLSNSLSPEELELQVDMTWQERYDSISGEFGVPRQLLALAEAIFETQPVDAARFWVPEFVRAIPVGRKFDSDDLIRMLENSGTLAAVFRHRWLDSLSSERNYPAIGLSDKNSHDVELATRNCFAEFDDPESLMANISTEAKEILVDELKLIGLEPQPSV